MTKPTALMMTTAGEWVHLEADPLASHAHIEDWNEQIKAVGYSGWGQISPQDTTPLSVEVFRSSDEDDATPMFMLTVSTFSNYEVVYAESAPALMEVLARWAPAVQGAALATLIGELQDNSSRTGFAGLVRKRLT